MSTLFAVSDESGGPSGSGFAYRAGFIGEASEWTDFVVPAWTERVLNRKPRIPYLHVTDAYNERWRAAHSLGRLQAQDRIDEAFSVLNASGGLRPLAVRMDASRFNRAVMNIKVAGKRTYNLTTDYLLYINFVALALFAAHRRFSGSQSVDVVVEANDVVTERLHGFHATMSEHLAIQGHPELAALLGELLIVPKTDPRTQIADLLCWHEQRRDGAGFSSHQEKVFAAFAQRHGHRLDLSKEDYEGFANRARVAFEPRGGSGTAAGFSDELSPGS